MISDTLHDAVTEIDDYLRDDGAGFYAEEHVRDWILRVRDSMESLRCALDTLPDGTRPPHRKFEEHVSA